MTILFGDYESYWADDYTLKKMTAVEYILDPRFDALGAGFAVDNGKSFWVDGPDLERFYNTIKWDETMFVSHNALFDACLLRWRSNRNPKLLGDTLGMARAWIGHRTRLSLEAVSAFYGLPPKMQTVNKLKGYNFQMLRQNPQLYNECVVYGCDDVEKCRYIFHQVIKDGFPLDQLEKIDLVLRMATEPRFIINQNLLCEYEAQLKAEKAQLLANAGLETRDPVMSDELLALMLMARGVDAPRKVSKVTGKEGWAFAKTDKDFTDLQEHEDPMVQAIVSARLGHKSTIEETRCGRFLDVSRINWPFGIAQRSMPIALNFSGAHTHRLSGAWKLNQQNLGRESKLRDALEAPPGYLVVSIDASQIEARKLAVLAGQLDLVDAFRLERDVYAEFADIIFGYPPGTVTKSTHPRERFIGKVAILSLGYNASWPTFKGMVRVQTNGQIEISDSEAARIVGLYRQRYNRIPEYWRFWQNMLPRIANGSAVGEVYGPITIGYQKLILPNRMELNYHNLRQETYDGKLKWVFDHADRVKTLYGAKVVENVTQALAFIHIIDCGMAVKRMTNGLLMPAHQVHDELIYIVPAHIAYSVGKMVARVFATPPGWMPSAPLAAEPGVGPSYGKIKK